MSLSQAGRCTKRRIAWRWRIHCYLLHLFSVCFSCPVRNLLIFVSAVVGIKAAGCTGSNNKTNLGREMHWKSHCPALAKAMILLHFFSFVLLAYSIKFIDICGSYGEHYGCWLYWKYKWAKARQGDAPKDTSPNLGKITPTFHSIFSVCCSRHVEKAFLSVSILKGITAVVCTGNSNKPKLGKAMLQKPQPSALEESLLPSTLSFLCVACVLWEIHWYLWWLWWALLLLVVLAAVMSRSWVEWYM